MQTHLIPFGHSHVVAFFALSLGGLICLICYRRLLHLLNRFPGPFVNSITRIPCTIALLRGQQHIYYYQLHRRYGPVVRVAPTEISFTQPSAWQDIYGNDQALEKPPAWTGSVARQDSGEVGLGMAQGREHTRHRRALAAGFTKNAVQARRDVMVSQVDKFLSTLAHMEGRSCSVNTTAWLFYLNFDMFGEAFYSQKSGCIDQGSATQWASSIPGVLRAAVYEQGIRLLVGRENRLQRLLFRFIPRHLALSRRLHVEWCRQSTQRRLDMATSSSKDLLQRILERSSGGSDDKALSPTEVILNIAVLVPASSETTSAALAAWAFLICTHRNEYDRLACEIRSAFPEGWTKDIDVDRIMALPYLSATLKEALRLFPPVSTVQQRIVPQGGATIDGYDLPPGTIVGLAQWAAARSPTYFHAPNNFHPERWLEDADERFAQDQHSASQPFSVGVRSCLGRNVAELQSRLAAAAVLLSFDLESESQEHEVTNRLWSLDPEALCLEAYQSLKRLDFWVRLKSISKKGV